MTEFHPLRSINQESSSAWNDLNKAAEKLAKESPCVSLPTLDHASMTDFDQVYEPSDDTYLLVDGIQADFATTTASDQSKFKTILEIGCGSGVPIVHLAKLLPHATPIATDINPNALAFAARTATENGVTNLEVVECDLASALIPKWRQNVDAVIFNPPYVPTPDDEVSGNGIEASWAGGMRGRRVIDRAIPQIAELLSKPHGICYMITVDDNEPEEMSQQFGALGLCMVPLVRRRARNEYLTVQKVTISTTTR